MSEYLKDILAGGIAGYIGSRLIDPREIVNKIRSKVPEALVTPADVIVYRDGDYAVAIDGKTKLTIHKSVDHNETFYYALEYIKKKGYGAISIAPGTYKVNLEINFSRISIFGSGAQPTRLEPADTSKPVISIVKPSDATEDLYGITLQNLFVAGNELPNTVDIIYIERVFDIRLINIYADGGSEKAGRSALRLFQGHEIDIIGCIFERTSGDAVVMISGDLSYHNRIIGGQITGSANTGLTIRNNAKHNKIIGTAILGSGEHGILITDGAEYNKIIGVTIGRAGINTWGVGIATSSNNNEIADTTIYDDQDTPTMRYAIYDTASSNYIHDIILPGNYVAGSIYTEGNSVIKRYIYKGKPSENSGVAKIPAGATSVTVNHGLLNTPSKVLITPLGQPAGKLWIENITSTSFDIVTDTAPSSDLNIAWYAEV